MTIDITFALPSLIDSRMFEPQSWQLTIAESKFCNRAAARWSIKILKKKNRIKLCRVIFLLEQIYFFNILLSATSRCLQHLQHLVVCNTCNISLPATPATSRCLQHLVACNTSLPATPRCLQHLVACNQHQLVLSYPHTNSTMRAAGQVRSAQSINISSFYPTHILIPRCERQVRSAQLNQSTSARFILPTY